MNVMLTVFILTRALSGCVTSERLAHTDTRNDAVNVQSTTDQRTAMPDPKLNSTVQSTIDDLKDRIKESPLDVEAILNLAQLHLIQSNWDLAEDSCREAIKVDLKNEKARKILAQLALRKGFPDMAQIILNGIGGVNSKDSQVLNLLAMIALQRNKPAEALGLFKKALKRNPEDLAVRMNLGVILLNYRLVRAAAVQFERVLKIFPSHQDAKLHLAIIHANRNKPEQAYAIYQQILKESDSNPLALYNLAVLEKNYQQYDKALDNLKSYLRTDYARTTNADNVFGLINEIQNTKPESEEPADDKEIQDLAKRLKDHQDTPRANKLQAFGVAKRTELAKPVEAGRSVSVEAPKPTQMTSVKSAVAPEQKATPKEKVEKRAEDQVEEIGELEQALRK